MIEICEIAVNKLIRAVTIREDMIMSSHEITTQPFENTNGIVGMHIDNNYEAHSHHYRESSTPHHQWR